MLALLTVALKSVAVYVFIVLAIRLFGKKEFAQLAITDVVFILLISNSVQNAMVGEDTSLPGGLVAASALFLVNFAFKYLQARSITAEHWLNGEPITLIYEGKLLAEALKKAEISHEELMAVLRSHGAASMEQVDLAVLELDGSISVLSNGYQKSSKRKSKGHKVLGKNAS